MFIWPAHIFNPTEITARIVESVISGGTALSGEEDVISTDGGGRWEISFGGITLRSPHQIKVWEAWEGHLKRGAVDCLVPLLSLGHANRSSHGRGLMPVSKLVCDDPIFPTSAEYSTPAIVAHLIGSAPLRATRIRIVVDHGAPLQGGEKFSVGGRAHSVVRPLGNDEFQIDPPLRDPLPGGAALVFDYPLVKCRAAPGESWSPTLSFGRRGDAQIRFLENAA